MSDITNTESRVLGRKLARDLSERESRLVSGASFNDACGLFEVVTGFDAGGRPQCEPGLEFPCP